MDNTGMSRVSARDNNRRRQTGSSNLPNMIQHGADHGGRNPEIGAISNGNNVQG
jgi:hypothetical protein